MILTLANASSSPCDVELDLVLRELDAEAGEGSLPLDERCDASKLPGNLEGPGEAFLSGSAEALRLEDGPGEDGRGVVLRVEGRGVLLRDADDRSLRVAGRGEDFRVEADGVVARCFIGMGGISKELLIAQDLSSSYGMFPPMSGIAVAPGMLTGPQGFVRSRRLGWV